MSLLCGGGGMDTDWPGGGMKLNELPSADTTGATDGSVSSPSEPKCLEKKGLFSLSKVVNFFYLSMMSKAFW